MNKWRLFAPSEDWLHPIEVEESVLPMPATLGERLGLRVGRDHAQRKFFLGLPEVALPKPSSGGEGVTYLSGLSILKAVLSVVEATEHGTTGVYMAVLLLAAKSTDRLSAHFTASEFFPQGDSSYRFLRISAELIRRLEKIPHGFGRSGHHGSLRLPAARIQPQRGWRVQQRPHRRPGGRYFGRRHFHRGFAQGVRGDYRRRRRVGILPRSSG